MKKLLLVLTITFATNSYGQFFKCIDKQKNVHYQEQPCTLERGKLQNNQISKKFEKRDPMEIQNEIYTLENQVAENDNSNYRYYRPESNELIQSQIRKERERDESWKPYRIQR